MAKATPMTRSRNQLASAYAPECFFTFEGGVGACIAHSMTADPASLAASTRNHILERLEQFGSAWLEAAQSCRDGNADQVAKCPVLPEQCVDRALLDEERRTFRLPGGDRIYFARPSNMGFTPAPLTFVCRQCSLFREYSTLKAFNRDIEALSRHRCIASRLPGGCCSWEQLDVIFVHWSGAWSPASPHRWDFRNGAATLNRTQCSSCGGEEMRLIRDSPRLGEWYFKCANTRCGKRCGDRWMQTDRDTLEMFRTKVGEGRLSGPTEINMEATPYRASNAYYAQMEQFIDFKDEEGAMASLLRLGAEAQLGDFLAQAYGLPSAPPTDDEVESACAKHDDCAEELQRFRDARASIQNALAQLSTLPQDLRPMFESLVKSASNSRDQVIETLRARRILTPKVELPAGVEAGIASRRRLFASRFDPFQLALEHILLKRTRLDVNDMVGGKRRYVSFKQLDRDLAPMSADDQADSERDARNRLAQLGIADMGLIREFELCRFSFGYSRMEASPVLHGKRGMNMPVRLRLFPPLRDDGVMKHPVYVVQQANQAIYVRLDEAVVVEWLEALEYRGLFSTTPGQRIGASILGIAQPMDRFLERLPVTDSPPAYFYIYTLLHSYAHLLMKQVSDYSGLDLGSLGEYVFPADLAFVVYRNGTTMDLGNLSAMWRNSGRALLASLLNPRSTQCGTGSLCATRGGACPDCLMVPETSCIASNKLLSRSVLRSLGRRPAFDARSGSIEGYLDIAARR